MKTNDGVNKHGLSRYIPSDVRDKIRRDAGYGCVICGTLFGDYEHIDPEFNNAHVHDPEKMTYLCVRCHGAVTRKRLSKSSVWKAKENPKPKQQGYVSDLIYPDDIEPVITIGNSKFKLTNVIINAFGKPLLWFEKPRVLGEPILLNAIFYNGRGLPVSYINRNSFVGLLGEHDISASGTIIKISPQKGTIGLEIDVNPEKPIEIKRMRMCYLGVEIEVDSKGQLIIKQGKSNFTLSSISVEGCGTGFLLGEKPIVKFRDSIGGIKPLPLAMDIVRRKCIRVTDRTGSELGWLYNGLILNVDYYICGSIKDKQVYSITDEYIGVLLNINNSVMLVNDSIEYETMEPIWIEPSDVDTVNVRSYIGYDLSYRLLSNNNNLRNATASKATASGNRIKKSTNPHNGWVESEKPIGIGDKVVLNFTGFLGEDEFEGGKAENFTLITGQGRMVPGFEESIIGKCQGDTVQAGVHFPIDYHAEHLRNQNAVFLIDILSVETPNNSQC